MGKLTYFAIDDVSLPYRHNVFLAINKPEVRKAAVLLPSEYGSGRPDDVAAHFYGTVLHDEGKYRMWYYACHKGINPDLPPKMMQQLAKAPVWGWECIQGPLCYAESEDGIQWSKPDLSQVSFKGSVHNNALSLPHVHVSGAAVIKDAEDPDPNRRYKMVYQFFPDFTEPVIEENGTMTTVATAVSPDGINWKVTGIPFINQFVEHCSFMKHDGKYIIHYHVMDNWGHLSEGGAKSGRTGVARVSTDFDYWPDVWVDTFALPEPQDHAKRGMAHEYAQVHLGVGAAGFGNVSIGIFGLWHNAAFDTFRKISGDLGLVISNDGLHFREPAKGFVFVDREDSPATPSPCGRGYNTILCQGNGILNVGEETLIYHGRWRNATERASIQDYSGEVALAKLPLDRWGSLSLIPGQKKGVVLSSLTELSGGERIRLNADGLEGISVGLLGEDFKPLPGFERVTMKGGGSFGAKVKWERALPANVKVYIKIEMNSDGAADPKLYAMYVE